MTDSDCVDRPDLIADAGAILRSLTPTRVATLKLVREGGLSQIEIADRLNVTSPAVSNYIETLRTLPHPLVKQDGHDYWTTSEGKQVVSALYRFGDNLGIALASEWTDEVAVQLAEGLSPLCDFRSDPPFYVLYALGVDCPDSLTVNPDPNPASLGATVSTVQTWLDEGITRRQVRDRILTYQQSGAATLAEKRVALTEKGVEQCRLLDQIMQLSADESIIDNNGLIDVEYRSDSGTSLSLPSEATPSELEQLAARFREEHGDIPLELVPVD